VAGGGAARDARFSDADHAALATQARIRDDIARTRKSMEYVRREREADRVGPELVALYERDLAAVERREKEDPSRQAALRALELDFEGELSRSAQVHGSASRALARSREPRPSKTKAARKGWFSRLLGAARGAAPRTRAPRDAPFHRLRTVERSGLPALAASRLDDLVEDLPRLESRLAGASGLDMASHEVRLLLERHLPDLIERYQRVPRAQRGERDDGGLTADERLLHAFDLARDRIDAFERQQAAPMRDAVSTQGRFLVDRYGR
jgi:hypothetical protein